MSTPARFYGLTAARLVGQDRKAASNALRAAFPALMPTEGGFILPEDSSPSSAALDAFLFTAGLPLTPLPPEDTTGHPLDPHAALQAHEAAALLHDSIREHWTTAGASALALWQSAHRFATTPAAALPARP